MLELTGERSVYMLVSAISQHSIVNRSLPYYGLKAEPEGVSTDTAYKLRKDTPEEDLPLVLDSATQWKNFCHKQILGEKLNIIA